MKINQPWGKINHRPIMIANRKPGDNKECGQPILPTSELPSSIHHLGQPSVLDQPFVLHLATRAANILKCACFLVCRFIICNLWIPICIDRCIQPQPIFLDADAVIMKSKCKGEKTAPLFLELFQAGQSSNLLKSVILLIPPTPLRPPQAWSMMKG